MQLQHIIDEPLKKNIENRTPKTVQEVCEVFKSTILESPILNHENIGYYGVESDYSIVDGKGYYRITFLYRVVSMVDGEQDEWTQSNDIEFEKVVGFDHVDLKNVYMGGIYNDEYTLVEMFDMFDRMETFDWLKNDKLKFEVYAQNVC